MFIRIENKWKRENQKSTPNLHKGYNVITIQFSRNSIVLINIVVVVHIIILFNFLLLVEIIFI
jgi:hypothetical protein